MSRVKQASHRSKAIPILGAAGLSLTMTGAVSDPPAWLLPDGFQMGPLLSPRRKGIN
jgi:hypothetical protein